MRVSIILIGLGLVLGLPTSGQALDPDIKCEAAKVKETAKYYACRLKAESKAIKKGEAPDYTKCDSKYSEKWQKAETKAGTGVCPTEGDEAAIQARMTDDADDIVTLLGGGTVAGCGDEVKNGTEDCDDLDLGGETCEGLGFDSGTLACSVGCGLDVSGCIASSSDCGDGFADPNANEQCDGSDLAGASCASLGYTLDGTLSCTAGCAYDTSLCLSQACPATGQTTCWDSSGSVIACAGTDHDGEILAGAALSYLDNGDGTISDLNTGLMWARKSDDGSIHDKDTTYTWDNAFAVHVAGLNSAVFAGHTDWRLPNVKELQGIVDYETFSTSVDPVFNTGCTGGCTVNTCSCTESASYWSSTSLAIGPTAAWYVGFTRGLVFWDGKSFAFLVRAVRGPP